MIVQCPACSSRYRIREANIPPSGGKIRCPQCGHSFVVYPESSQDDHEQDEDRTSITSQNALNQLVSGMASSNKNIATEERTEQIDKDEVNRIRALQQLAKDAEGADDGTVEMQNPMKIWQQAQDAVRRADGLEAASEGEEYDDAATEVVSGAGLAKLPFPSRIPASAPAKVPAHEPASSYGERIEMPASKPIPPPMSSGPPALPKPPALPGSASSGQFPTQSRGGSGQFPTPGSGGSGQFPAPRSGSGQFPTPGGSGQYPAPGSGGSGQFPAPESGGYSQPGSGPKFPTSDPSPPSYGQPMSPPRGYAAEPWDGGAADASRDILAAIDEVTGAEDLATPEPDLQHGGPWKLKTNFGLTYEFPDNKSLRSWLSSRDELDGYTLSADGENFFVVHVFTQLKSRPSAAGQIPSTGMSHLGLQQPGGLGALPGSAASGQFPAPGSGQYPAMGSGQYPAMGGGGGFTPPSQISQTMQQPSVGHGLPQNEVIQNTYRPPSRDAGSSKILWVVFAFLVAICVALALHTFDVINIVKLLGLEKEEYVAPIGVVVEPVSSIDSVIDSDPEAEIENLLREARRDVRNKKLQSAIDRLRTIETLDPNRIEVFELRAQAFESLGKPDEAEAARERAEELRNAQPPESPDGEQDPDAPTP